ncbi:TetR/AcrR family transcriptional regulator [Streptomyces chartreusis]|uniref:TetR/AcrR family transcriptional regulator n=1 Tax=Streptomyces chartreusis TaxID=1969 RepID=UPI002E81CB61|nr:TetR family transcriptional regulator [Streptomyces chartreusis]WUB20573.1 TetR family transcriptional regulator [Streptomyces chartreusis]
MVSGKETKLTEQGEAGAREAGGKAHAAAPTSDHPPGAAETRDRRLGAAETRDRPLDATKAHGRPLGAAKTRGRPRSFDRETALEKAILAFWERGYEATSVSDLTRAMDIGAPSLYAAFGDKRSLFEEVVRVYSSRYAAFADHALADAPTSRDAVERTLREAAGAYTEPDRPHGCLIAHAAINCTTPEVANSLRDRRNATIAAFEGRIEEDIAAGALPAGTDAGALARHTGAMIQGMSQQARDGASREELEALVEIAMAIWPRT